jgi:WD40 repeat protein
MSRNDRFAAIASWEHGGATVWDVNSGKCVAELPIRSFGVPEFSPDNSWLATTPGGVQIWRTSDWTLAHDLHAEGTTPDGLGIAFSFDSRALAVGQPNGELRLVDPNSGADWARIMHRVPGPTALMSFTSDNRYLVALSTDSSSLARIWDLAAMRRSLKEFGLDFPADVLSAKPSAAAPTALQIEWSVSFPQVLEMAR